VQRQISDAGVTRAIGQELSVFCPAVSEALANAAGSIAVLALSAFAHQL